MITLRRFTLDDVEAHHAGEDDESVRWLTEGHRSTVESTTAWIRRGWAVHDGHRTGEYAFAIELDGRLAGMIAANPVLQEGCRPGDVNVSYGIHPWARGRGVAAEAVGAVAAMIVERGWGSALVLRIEPDNHASLGVARRAGIPLVGEIPGSDPVMLLHRLELIS